MLTFALVALVIITVSAGLIHLIRTKPIQRVRGPPSPSFLLGHEHALSTQNEVGDLEFEWLRTYGPTWRIRGEFGIHVLMTADPKALQHIYHKSAYNYTKRTSANIMAEIMTGPGIAVSLGRDHQRHRKIMNPAFSAAHLRTFLPLFQRIGTKMVEQWKTDLSGAERMSMVVNKWLSRATMDIIGEAAFDYQYGALDKGAGSPIIKAYDNLFSDINKPSAMVALFRATWDYIPIPILRLFRFVPAEPFTRLRNLRGLFTEYGKQILREQRAEIDVEKVSKSKDVMSILIKANSSADPQTRLSDAEIMAEMFTLTLAGHETTASTLTFLTYELAKHPEYQARLRKEIQDRRALVMSRGDASFSMEDLDSLTLTMNAIKETLRFHPIVSYLPRVATKDDVIPLAYPIVSTTGETITEIPVHAGQVIFPSFMAYQRIKDIWGEDADVWNPDRWLRPETGKQTKVGVFANLMTFSAGVQACIGWKFSIIEMQALLAEIIENFELSLSSEKHTIRRAPAGFGMVPMIEGREDLGTALPLQVSLVQQ
ncbi:cytochrome P450 [Polyporus arcularius HHB13444]|uniref:Cytochrome P450 n=1 Tax=Polyporus arcularius HHB13444 TaxID=1314778 RepID=A0A5C3NVQ3_9APHY|nr:cytochrome P450 [Polyporus arcularius HHB13444]